MTKTAKIILSACIIVLIIVVAVSFSHSNKSGSDTIKIGISTMLSGNWAVLGDNIVAASKMAVEDINAAGGINGKKIELVIEDSGLDSKSGLSAAQKLINVDGIKYIIGGTSSNGTIAAAPIANENHVLYLTPVTGGTNVDQAGEYVMRTANSDLLVGNDLANAMVKLGFKNVSTISEVTEYTTDIKKTFESKVASLGGKIVSSEEFQPGTSDFRTLIAKTKAAHPQAMLVISQTGVGGATFVKQAYEAGLDVPVFTDFTFVTNTDAQKILGSFDGIYYADPKYDASDPTVQNFFKRYTDIYGHASPIPFHAASAYDSVTMLAAAIKASGDDSVKVHDWLLNNVKNWKGLMGTYSLDANGNSDLGFTIKVMKNGKAEDVVLK